MRKAFSLAGMIALLAAAVPGQEPRQGPVKPPPGREVKRIPVDSNVEPPPIPVEEIVRRFTEKEDEFKRAYDQYTYRLKVRVQEFDDDGSPSGEIQMTAEIYSKPDGNRYARVLAETPPTLKRAALTRDDLEELIGIPAFTLPTSELGKYDLTYAGKQQVDEITAYAFRVQPKRLERRVRLFEGVIWVDDRDLEIVKTYGKYVSEVGDAAPAGIFKLFETYREIVDNRYRLPTYTSSEDTVKLQKGTVRVKLTIRASEFKPVADAAQKDKFNPR